MSERLLIISERISSGSIVSESRESSERRESMSPVRFSGILCLTVGPSEGYLEGLMSLC